MIQHQICMTRHHLCTPNDRTSTPPSPFKLQGSFRMFKKRLYCLRTLEHVQMMQVRSPLCRDAWDRGMSLIGLAPGVCQLTSVRSADDYSRETRTLISVTVSRMRGALSRFHMVGWATWGVQEGRQKSASHRASNNGKLNYAPVTPHAVWYKSGWNTTPLFMDTLLPQHPLPQHPSFSHLRKHIHGP
jgi:hypothetical protein